MDIVSPDLASPVPAFRRVTVHELKVTTRMAFKLAAVTHRSAKLFESYIKWRREHRLFTTVIYLCQHLSAATEKNHERTASPVPGIKPGTVMFM